MTERSTAQQLFSRHVWLVDIVNIFGETPQIVDAINIFGETPQNVDCSLASRLRRSMDKLLTTSIPHGHTTHIVSNFKAFAFEVLLKAEYFTSGA